MTDRTIVDAAARLRRNAEPHLVATVVKVEGTGYRRPGARLLMTRYRWIAGAVSGGCLEGDISNQGWLRTADGAPAMFRFDSARMPAGADDENLRAAFGLGGDGVVEVLVERAGVTGKLDALELWSRCLRTQRRGVVATVFRADGPDGRIGTRMTIVDGEELAEDASPIPAELKSAIEWDMRLVLETGVSGTYVYETAGTGVIEVLIEAVWPPPRLFLFGSGHDAVPVAQIARHVGWDVMVCIARPRLSTKERFTMADEILVGNSEQIAARIGQTDRPIAVVMGHDYDRDREHLKMLAGTRACYIAMLGPESRTARMISELALAHDPRIHAAIGVEHEMETPPEISLAIIATVQSALHAPARAVPLPPSASTAPATAARSARPGTPPPIPDRAVRSGVRPRSLASQTDDHRVGRIDPRDTLAINAGPHSTRATRE